MNQSFKSSGSSNKIRGIYSSDDMSDIYSSDITVDSSDWKRTRCSHFLERKTGYYCFYGISWEAKLLGFPVSQGF